MNVNKEQFFLIPLNANIPYTLKTILKIVLLNNL